MKDENWKKNETIGFGNNLTVRFNFEKPTVTTKDSSQIWLQGRLFNTSIERYEHCFATNDWLNFEPMRRQNPRACVLSAVREIYLLRLHVPGIKLKLVKPLAKYQHLVSRVS